MCGRKTNTTVMVGANPNKTCARNDMLTKVKHNIRYCDLTQRPRNKKNPPVAGNMLLTKSRSEKLNRRRNFWPEGLTDPGFFFIFSVCTSYAPATVTEFHF